ncbi:MAG: cytochrome c biogenesis CcdA family protein [Acidimicrobiales bacterium]
MTGDVTLIAAFGAGLISFLSPCVLPIIPAYLSLVTGLEISDLEEGGRANLPRIARDTSLFVLGFGSVFVLLGLGATSVGSLLLDKQALLIRGSGVVVLSMALFVLGSLYLQAPWLYREARLHPDLSRYGPMAAPVAGVAFGFGWTPCIGPVLTSVLAVAAADGRAGRGALLLAIYAAGLGLPFLVTGLAFGRSTLILTHMKRHLRGVTLFSAAAMAFFGVLLTLDRLRWLTTQIQTLARAVGLDWLVTLG